MREDDFALIDVVQLSAINKIDGVFVVQFADNLGRIYIEGGEVIHATIAGNRIPDGEESFRTILSWPDARFYREKPQASIQRTIKLSTTHLLLESLKKLDEAKLCDRGRQDPSSQSMSPSEASGEASDRAEGGFEQTDGSLLSGGERPPTRTREDGGDRRMSTSPIQQLISEMKTRLPGAVATGVYSITDGLMLAIDSDVPDTNVEAMSAIHSHIWDRISNFMKILPPETTGQLTSMTLEVKGATFFIIVDYNRQIALMAGIGKDGNLGMLRVMATKYLSRIGGLL